MKLTNFLLGCITVGIFFVAWELFPASPPKGHLFFAAASRESAVPVARDKWNLYMVENSSYAPTRKEAPTINDISPGVIMIEFAPEHEFSRLPLNTDADTIRPFTIAEFGKIEDIGAKFKMTLRWHPELSSWEVIGLEPKELEGSIW